MGQQPSVRLPKHAAATAGLREGATLDLTIEDDAIVLRRQRYDIAELVAAMAEVEQPPMLMDDAPRGSEVW